MQNYRNNFSGLHAPGYRFRFNIRSISHRALFLPLQMKQDPAVIRLLNGENPCSVFNVSSINDARRAFNSLRLKYDFPFWAATQFPILHIDDPDRITTLILNESQHRIIDIFLKRFFDKQIARYVITKQTSRIGLTTCVQAYIIWLQIFSCPKNSNICGASMFNVDHLKANIARLFNWQTVPSYKRKLPIVNRFAHSFFNSFNKPDALRGIDFGYVHLADISKWHDPDGVRTSRAFVAANSGVLLNHMTFVAFEGNLPSVKKNPVFLGEINFANDPHKIKVSYPINVISDYERSIYDKILKFLAK